MKDDTDTGARDRLYLPQDRYLAALGRFRTRIAAGVPLTYEDSDASGDKYSRCSWGLCSDDKEAWPDADDHLWPEQFRKRGRVAPRYRKTTQGCPLDRRVGMEDEDNMRGCFHSCRIFNPAEPPLRISKNVALRLYDEAILLAAGVPHTVGDLPSVGGETCERTPAELERACLVLLREEQEKVAPDSAVIGVLCDAVRLSRECRVVVATEAKLRSEAEESAVKSLLESCRLVLEVLPDRMFPDREVRRADTAGAKRESRNWLQNGIMGSNLSDEELRARIDRAAELLIRRYRLFPEGTFRTVADNAAREIVISVLAAAANAPEKWIARATAEQRVLQAATAWAEDVNWEEDPDKAGTIGERYTQDLRDAVLAWRRMEGA